jgi:hypothetical protein
LRNTGTLSYDCSYAMILYLLCLVLFVCYAQCCRNDPIQSIPRVFILVPLTHSFIHSFLPHAFLSLSPFHPNERSYLLTYVCRNAYFTGDPVPVPSTCMLGAVVNVQDADASLTSVLDAGRIRIGISRGAGSFPLLYSVDGSDGSTSTDLELQGAALDGYEIACAKEAVRRIGVKYSVGMAAIFDVLPAPPFFPALVGALDDGIVDVAWTQIAVNNARADQVDFTCPTFFTTYRITAGAGVGATPPPADGDPVEVACTAIFCTFDVPAPFVLVDTGLSGPDYDFLLYSPNSQYEYTIGAVEEYLFLFENECTTCVFVDVDPVGSSTLAPATRQGAPETKRPTGSPTMESESSSRVCGSSQGLVTAVVVGALAAGVAAL